MMHKVLISLAAAASALTVATPASAQYFPAPPPPPGYGYGHGHYNYGHFRSLKARIDGLQHHINRLDSRDILSEREARRLRDESRDVERRLFHAARNGLGPREAALIDHRIRRLEQRVWRDAHDRNRWGWGDRR
jgi:hypothetical protein